MGDLDVQSLWALARRQHGVITHGQLIEAGLSRKAIKHRVAKGRLHPLHQGVFAVGWPAPTRHGEWMAAVLACAPGAVLSHRSAAALYGIGRTDRLIDLSVARRRNPRRPGLRVHRVELPERDLGERLAIPVTSPARTVIDLAAVLGERRLEAAVNAADKLNLIDPEALRAEVERRPPVRGTGRLRKLLDRDTFVLTESELERRFMRLVHRAGLPRPETGVMLNGFRVDFYWRELGLVVETDGLRYHRTTTQQTRDRRRDQAHAAAGVTTLRFTHQQVWNGAEWVERTLIAVARRLRVG